MEARRPISTPPASWRALRRVGPYWARVELADESGRAERVPGDVVPVPAHPPARAGAGRAGVHRGRPVHLRRARRVHQALDLRRRPLALLLRAPGPARFLPRDDARGRAAPAPPGGDDGRDLSPGLVLQGRAGTAVRRGPRTGAPPGGGRHRRDARRRAGRGDAGRTARLEAQDDARHRPGLVPRPDPPRGRAPPPHQPRRPRGRVQVLVGRVLEVNLMDQRILEFIGDLRRAEMHISPSEALDALAASAEIGLEDRETFKSALATTLVKEARDYPTFDRLFDLYFLDLEALGAGLKKALGPEDPRIQEMLNRLAAEDGLEMDALTELMLRGEGSDMEMAIRQGGQNAGLERLMYFLQTGYFSRRIYDKFDWETIERDLGRIMQMLEAQGMDPGVLARIRNYFDLRLEAFRRMIRQHVERELERRAYRQGERLTREVLTDKPLFALSPDEVAQMKAVVARLARKIKDALALRQRQEEKGRLDSRRTIRKSLQYGGVPMEVRFRRRHREKPKLITLCDV